MRAFNCGQTRSTMLIVHTQEHKQFWMMMMMQCLMEIKTSFNIIKHGIYDRHQMRPYATVNRPTLVAKRVQHVGS